MEHSNNKNNKRNSFSSVS
uniref:Uncharacterized protein n=1 Tax=Arundo donax TaxID=35708 RepID=A0A0A9BW87_ARUDO